MIAGIILIALLAVAFMWIGVATSPTSSRYPDGKCYLCRQREAWPGETCPKCGTEQP